MLFPYTTLFRSPAVGASLVWGPVALYLIVAADELWRGIILIVYGVGIIGMMDNLLRPVLVGRDTRLPDYLVLLSTLGGLTVFGINGLDRKSTRLNSSHVAISYAVFCLKKKNMRSRHKL